MKRFPRKKRPSGGRASPRAATSTGLRTKHFKPFFERLEFEFAVLFEAILLYASNVVMGNGFTASAHTPASPHERTSGPKGKAGLGVVSRRARGTRVGPYSSPGGFSAARPS